MGLNNICSSEISLQKVALFKKLELIESFDKLQWIILTGKKMNGKDENIDFFRIC